jgi:hypothetical protein
MRMVLLIGWSATFTYLKVKELWPLHGSKARRRKPAPASPD